MRGECCDREAVISVLDNGPGIDAAGMATLFHKFERLEQREAHEGLGLGLYIVRELVNAHGGRVAVESLPGKGSCFSVYLPIIKSGEQTLARAG